MKGMKDKDQRRDFFAFLGGKLLAVGLVLASIKFVIGPFLHSVAGAQDARPRRSRMSSTPRTRRGRS